MIEATGVYTRSFLGEFFISHMFIIMSFIFFIFLILIALNFKRIIEKFSKINRKTWILLLAIFLVGFILRNDAYFYGMEYDGAHYQETANGIYETGLYVKGCAIGNLQYCRLYHQVLFPAGFPYLIVLLYHIFGQTSLWSMILSAFLGSLTIILIYLISYLLFKNEHVGLYAALVFSLIPLEIMINGSASVRPVSSFFISATILLFLIALEEIEDIKLWSLFAITFSYSIYVRQENSLLLIPMLFLLLFNKNGKKIIRNINLNYFKEHSKICLRCSIPIAIFLISQIPVQHWILFGNVDWNPLGPIFSFKYFYVMAPIMLQYLFYPVLRWTGTLYNPLVSIAFFLNSYFIIFNKKNRRELLSIWLWFILFFILFASFFQCPGFPDNIPTNFVRYMTALNIPYAILSGFVLFKIGERVKLGRHTVISIIFIILILTSSITIPATMFKDARLDEKIAGDMINAVNRTENECLIFISQCWVPNSDMLKDNKRRWIDTYLIMSGTENLIKKEMNNSKCIIFIKDNICRNGCEERYKFIYDNLDLEFMFNQGVVEVYKGTLKNI